MTTVQITLPDALAQEAERAGLLAPERVEKWLRDELKSKAWEDLSAAMERMSAVDDPPYMSPEDVAEEIKRMRSERRARQTG
jgi:Arc/MetJ family transcription regulator